KGRMRRSEATERGEAMSDSVAVRRATRGDLPTLGRLGAGLGAIHHAFDAERFLPPAARIADRDAGFLGDQLNQPNALVMVAQDSTGVIGYAYGALEGPDFVSLRGPAGVLHDLMVDPDHRRRGIGRLLTTRIIDELRSLGARQIV